MRSEILEYLTGQRVGVLAVELPDNSIHAATVHFARIESVSAANMPALMFMTGRGTKKCQLLVQSGSAKAAFVVGTSEEEMKTFQLNGQAYLSEDAAAIEEYFIKFPEKKERYNPERDVFVLFKPSWWRFSDMKNPAGKLIISSED